MIFISCAREDRTVAADLVRELDAEGIGAVIDPELAESDPFWRDAIARWFPSCRMMVGLASAHADASPWVHQEQRAYTGPKLWIAVDGKRRAEEPALEYAPNVVERREALSAIGAVLARSRDHRRSHKNAHLRRPSNHEERLRRIHDQRTALERFVRSNRRHPSTAFQVAGDVAQIEDGTMELRRIASRIRAGRHATFVGTTPVTNAHFRAFVEATGYPQPPTWQRAEFRVDDAPVTGVTWFESRAFAAWLGGDLPTEMEWLQSARGNDDSRRFATATGDIDPSVAHFDGPFIGGAPVGATTYRPTPEGYYGLCGNSWDWCASAWGPFRVIRGGGCMDVASFCAVQARYRNAPIDRDCSVGFRIKVTLQQ